MLDDLEIFVINLDRSTERMQMMDARLEKLGLRYTRVPAVDGSTVDLAAETMIDAVKYSRAHGKSVVPSEVGCYVSHYNTMKEFLLRSNKKYALVLEDDMLFDDGFMAALESLLKNESWDMVKLNGLKSRRGNVRKARLTERHWLAVNFFPQSKSGAYLINRKAAEAYTAKLMPMFMPFDHEFTKFWKYGLRGFSVLPFPAKEDGAPSLIDYMALRRGRKPWYKRLDHALYEAYVTIMRLMYAASTLRK